MDELLARFPKNVSLGLGHQSVVHKVALNSGIKAFEPDNNENKQIRIHVETSNALDDVTTKVDAALSVSAGNLPVPATVNASVKSHFENTHKETHAYTVITVDRISKSTSYKNVTLDDDALALLNGSDDDLRDFYAKYGDGFVRSITYGNKIVFVLRTDKSEVASLKQLETELGVKIQDAEVAAKLGVLRQKLNSVKTEDRLFISIGNSDFFETKPEAEEQTAPKPEPAKPEAAKPVTPKPEAPKSEAEKPALAKAAEKLKAVLAKSDAQKPEAEKSEPAKEDVEKPAAEQSKADATENSGDFDKKLAAYLKSDSTAIIDYDKEPYSSVKNVPIKVAKKLEKIVSDELGLFLRRINVCLETIEGTKILAPNNLVEQNKYPAKTRDAYYEQYELLRKQTEVFQKELLQLAHKYGKIKTTLTDPEKTELEKSLSQIEDFLTKNEKNLKTTPKLTLIRKIVLPKGETQTKGFKLDFDDEMKSTTKFLFISTEDKGATEIQVKMQKYRLTRFTCPTEETAVSARGCYFPSNIGRNYLGVKLISPEALDHNIDIKVYAASEAALREYDITSLNERAKTTRPLDGAVGEDVVIDEAEARKQGYLNHDSEEKSNAELTSSMGLDYDEGEEFELETVKDYENEIGQNNSKSSEKPKGP